MEAKIKHKFDLREAVTPFTLLKITQAFREMKKGELMQVNGNDAKTKKEILKVLNTFHYDVIDKEDKDNFYCICLKKKG